ncbi:hypothetical protein ACJ41O_011542 [Fusarium nematophilum]
MEDLLRHYHRDRAGLSSKDEGPRRHMPDSNTSAVAPTGLFPPDSHGNPQRHAHDFGGSTHDPAAPAITSASTSAPPGVPRSVAQTLEEASKRLHELSMMGTGRSFLFPLVILPDDLQAPASTPFHVKLDTGCELNWISARVLERAQLEGKQEELMSAKAWLGFNGDSDLVVPKATITLTWCSVNAAYTHRHEFLVHDDVPFDVVLGSEFIIEESWKKSFNDPVLALRHTGLSDGKSLHSMLYPVPYLQSN